MESLHNLLSLYTTHITPPPTIIKKEISRFTEKICNVRLGESDIKIQEDTVYIDVSSIHTQEYILQNKKLLIEKIQSLCGNRKLTQIRFL